MNKTEEKEYYNKMNTQEMSALYEVIVFSYGICEVRRKSDNVRGFLNFDHMPRFYWGFSPIAEVTPL